MENEFSTFDNKNVKSAGQNVVLQNRRDHSKFKDYWPLQNCLGLISLKPEIAYFAYMIRDAQLIA
jgi:hypothetical protein